jgi:hypothetical protein
MEGKINDTNNHRNIVDVIDLNGGLWLTTILIVVTNH